MEEAWLWEVYEIHMMEEKVWFWEFSEILIMEEKT